jgi:pseudaminic acid cytidylyltransferase
MPLSMETTQFYREKPEAWIKGPELFVKYFHPEKIPHWRVLNINTNDDWKLAEIFFKTKK